MAGSDESSSRARGACALAQRSAPGSRDAVWASSVEFGCEIRIRVLRSVRPAVHIRVSSSEERRMMAAAEGVLSQAYAPMTLADRATR